MLFTTRLLVFYSIITLFVVTGCDSDITTDGDVDVSDGDTDTTDNDAEPDTDGDTEVDGDIDTEVDSEIEQTIVDPCDPNPCEEENKTVCSDDGEGNVVCSCDEGFEDYGDSKCKSSAPCGNDTACVAGNRECNNNQGIAECGDCLGGYHEEGNSCVEDISCGDSTCNGHGDCTDDTGIPVCACTEGYAGDNCENCDAANSWHWNSVGDACTTDLCDPNPCNANDHRVCEAGTGTCLCDTGFCVIDNTCIADGTANPDHVCSVCDSATNKNNWTLGGTDFECRASAGICDVAEVCDGVNNDCPEDTKVATDTPCDDGLYCNGDDACDGNGICIHSGNPCLETECNRCQENIDSCFVAENTACNDNLFCNGDDTCDGNGGCSVHTGSPCPETECKHCQEDSDSCYDPVGTACANIDQITCDSAYTCNSTGTCLGDITDDNTPCDFDDVYCTADICQSSICQVGLPDDELCEPTGGYYTCDASFDCYDAGWVATFGDTSLATANDVVGLVDGSMAIVGYFQGTVDFDPGEGVDNHTSNGDYDIFISVLNADGTHRWTKTFGGLLEEKSYRITQITDGGIAVVGTYSDTVDFDPGEGIDNHTSNGEIDVFVSVLNVDGTHRWTKTFGGSKDDSPTDITNLADGGLAVIGRYSDTVDFDPGEGVKSYTSYFGFSYYISVLNDDGTHRWVKAYCEEGSIPRYKSITQLVDGGLAITGDFTNTPDFDPGEGVDNNTSSGNADVFVSVFNIDGSYRWTRTFGGEYSDSGYSITQLTDGGMALTGSCTNTADLDPGEGVEIHSCYFSSFINVLNANGTYRWATIVRCGNGFYSNSIKQLSDRGLALIGSCLDYIGSDYYLDVSFNVFDVDGNDRWTKTFGGSGNDHARTFTQLADGGLAIAGNFSDTVDFHHGEGVDNHTANGESDIFVLRYNPPPVCSSVDSDACNGNGTCNWTSGTGICFCEEEYKGVLCEECEEGYLEYPDCVYNPCPDMDCSHLDDECNTGVCEYEGSGQASCVAHALAGNECDDTDVCTANDACNSEGICTGAIYDCNEKGTCNAENDVCTCDTGFGGDYCDECAENYVGFPDCYISACVGYDCSNLDDGCYIGVCELDENLDAFCVSEIAVGKSCDDENDCTRSDVCNEEAVCVGTEYDCNGHGTCNDGNNYCTCYSNWYGNYCSYDHDFTVVYKDPDTGLEWQKNATYQTRWFNDNYEIRDLPVRYCNNLELDGGGWSLPNISQLRTLVKGCDAIEPGGICKVTTSCTSEIVADGCWSTATCGGTACNVTGCVMNGNLSGPCDNYWSSTHAGNPDYHNYWVLGFGYASIFEMGYQEPYYIRCVR